VLLEVFPSRAVNIQHFGRSVLQLENRQLTVWDCVKPVKRVLVPVEVKTK
jgi:hypothetical protein